MSSLRVSRSGGFGGLTREGVLDLSSSDPRVPEARSLLARVDLQAAASPQGQPGPDRFVYRFEHGGSEVTVHEAALTDDLRALADLVLG